MHETNPTEFEKLMIDLSKNSKSTTSDNICKSLIESQNKLTKRKQDFDAKADNKKQDSKLKLNVKYKMHCSDFQNKRKGDSTFIFQSKFGTNDDTQNSPKIGKQPLNSTEVTLLPQSDAKNQKLTTMLSKKSKSPKSFYFCTYVHT